MYTLNWKQLEYFITLAEIQNYTKAASVLNITQPALSRAINNLEESIGISLFEKSGRGVKLNFYGHILYQHLRVARDKIYEGEREVRSLISSDKGHISVGSLYTLGINFLPLLLRDFNKEYPQITFSLYQHPTRVLLDLLNNNEIDICFCTDFNKDMVSDRLMKTIISTEPLYMLVPRTHPLAGQKTANLYDFKDDTFILFNNLTLFHGESLALFSKAGFSPRVAYEANEDSTVAGFVAAGLGVALIPPIYGVNTDQCVPIALNDPDAFRTLCMVYKSENESIPVVNKFHNYVISWLAENRDKIAPNYYQ